MEDIIDVRLIPNPAQLANRPAWTARFEMHLPNYGEALIFLAVLLGGMWLSRRRNYSIMGQRTSSSILALATPRFQSNGCFEALELYAEGHDETKLSLSQQSASRDQILLCLRVRTIPISLQFRKRLLSRLFPKFPFAVEVFYWLLYWLFYRITTVLANRIFAGGAIWHAAQAEAISIMAFEQFGALSFFFPCREVDIQQFFMNRYQSFLTFLDRFSSVSDIPDSMMFLVWYYHVAPSHATFACVRRTMALTNLMAFITFVLFPTILPRLLPAAYGFLDTVYMDDATSLWRSGKHVNSLAAMLGMYFGYSFIIGCPIVHHPGVCQLSKCGTRRKISGKIFYAALGLLYLALTLITIIATASHFFPDVVVAVSYCTIAFVANKVSYVLLP